MSRKSLTTLIVIVVAAATANSAFAGCGGRKYYGGSNLHHRYISSHNHGVYKRVYHKPVVVREVHRPVVVEKRIIDHCHHPKFCLAYVCPGETLLSICGREYGNPNLWTLVARFNHLPLGAPLAAGQPIKLPTIYDSGRMTPSDAPVPPAPAVAVPAAPVAVRVAMPAGPAAQPGFAGGFPQGLPQGQPGFAPQGLPQGQTPQGQPQQQFGQPMPPQQQPQQPALQPNSNAPQLNIRQAERATPTFTGGSQLVLDGQQFGGTPGQVQLVVGPMTVPVAIANWTPSELTIQLPELPLTKASDARVVVLDSTGKLITQSDIRLAPTSSRLAMGN